MNRAPLQSLGYENDWEHLIRLTRVNRNFLRNLFPLAFSFTLSSAKTFSKGALKKKVVILFCKPILQKQC